MSRTQFVCLLVGTAALALFTPGGSARGQSDRRGEVDLGAAVSTVLTGRVVGPDGAPAGNAVVVTTMGGQAVTDSDGRFSLEVRLDPEAESLRVTAVLSAGTRTLTGSTQLAGLACGGQAFAGTLRLEEGGDCEPGWLPTFGPSPGLADTVMTLAVFDDGDGPALYAGGQFEFAYSALQPSFIARWNGTSWAELGSGLNDWVLALAVFDDGFGPALYAGGRFTTAGGLPAAHIARWKDSSWSALGDGLDDWVLALEVFDDGSGPALFAGGQFTTAGGLPAGHVAQWDGAAWTGLGSGMDDHVLAFETFDDGGGAALYAGGQFTTAGGVAASRLARWNGASWSALGSGVDGSVMALTVYDAGTGPALYAGGQFTVAGGIVAMHIARWDGAIWSTMGAGSSSGTDGDVFALATFDDGSGPALFAGGSFAMAGDKLVKNVAKWNGSIWSELDGGLDGYGPVALAAFDDGSGGGPALFMGGAFWTPPTSYVYFLVKWTGVGWSLPGTGIAGEVTALAVFDDGSGPALHAAGFFTWAGGLKVNHVAKWNGSTWSALGSGTNNNVWSLGVFDDGGGPALYAGGTFTEAGGKAAIHIAKWDGIKWSPLGGGVTAVSTFYPTVRAMAVFDDGSGSALYVGGIFQTAGGVTVNHIAKWDGSSWSALGSGAEWEVRALTAFDDGSGPALYVGGSFKKAGGVQVNHIAKWDGSTWSALGSGMSGGTTTEVYALAVFDDGNGRELYAGGDFYSAGGVSLYFIAKWDGSLWSTVGNGPNGSVWALRVFNDGSGSALYAGGGFSHVGSASVEVNYIAKWNGAHWSGVGNGFDNLVMALQDFEAGGSAALFAGGGFLKNYDSLDGRLARLAGCPGDPSPWVDVGFALPGASGPPLLEGFGDLTPGSAGRLSLEAAAPLAPTILFIALDSTPSPFQCGTLVPLPVLASMASITSLAGEHVVAWAAWPAGLTGLSLYFQHAIQDPAASCGVALSNALLAEVP